MTHSLGVQNKNTLEMSKRDFISEALEKQQAVGQGIFWPSSGLHDLEKTVPVIASNSYLHDITCQAARTIPDARLIEHLEIETAIMDLGAEFIAPTILSALE